MIAGAATNSTEMSIDVSNAGSSRTTRPHQLRAVVESVRMPFDCTYVKIGRKMYVRKNEQVKAINCRGARSRLVEAPVGGGIVVRHEPT